MTQAPAQDLVLLTVAEVAARLRVSKMTVYRLCRSGELESGWIGGSVRIDEADLAEYIRAAFAAAWPGAQ